MKRAFFFLGLGFMLLFDFQTALRSPDTGEVYAILDLFPDALGWILLTVGLWKLAKKDRRFASLRISAFVHVFIAVFFLLTETAFFSHFHTLKDGLPETGLVLKIAEQILWTIEILFATRLFDRVYSFCRERKEEKIAAACRTQCVFILLQAIFATLALVLKLTPASEMVLAVADRLQYLFWILVVWFGAITLIRCDLKISD